MMDREFDRVREELCRAGIPASSLSVSDGSTITITSRDGRALVRTSLHYRDGRAAEASADVELHRAMYARSRHRAVLVCQPPYVMTLASMGKVSVVEALEKLPRAHTAACEVVVVKGRAAVAGAIDADACLDAMLGLERRCREQLPGASRV